MPINKGETEKRGRVVSSFPASHANVFSSELHLHISEVTLYSLLDSMAQAPVAWLDVTSAERPNDEFLKQTPTISLNMPSATPAMRKIPAKKSPSFQQW